jgi:MarR-like DNA-binding transcriptional regulator SgrR of sgrS sRNA
VSSIRRRSFTFLFDTAPLAGDASQILDFSSLHHYAALSEPLFRWDVQSGKVRRSACASYGRSRSGHRHAFQLRHDLAWSDGRRVTGDDYAGALDAILHGRSPHAARLRSIERVSVEREGEGDRLVIETRWPDQHLAAKLAHPSCSPFGNVSATHRAAGPFIEVERDDRGSVLRRNRFHRTAHTRDTSVLRFEICDSADDGIERYLKGAADATCPALFPYRRLEDLRDRHDFMRPTSNTFVVLLPASPRALDPGLRKRVQSAIDRKRIASRLAGALTAIRGFTASGASYSTDACSAMEPRLVELVEPLVIAYDDFSPNGEIARHVRSDLLRTGMDATLCVDSYARPWRSCDFRMVVLVSSPADPSAMFVHLGLTPAVALDEERRDRYWQLIREYDQSADGAESLAALDAMVEEHAYAIVVGRLEQYYLKTPALRHFRWDADISWERM